MALRVRWYIKDRIFLIEAKGIVSDEEFIALGCSPIMLSAMDESPAPMLHYFFDLVDPNTKLPSLKVRGKTEIEKHKKDGWSLFIHFKLNPMWRMTASIIAQVGQARFRFVDSHQEALNFMRVVDRTLPIQPDTGEEDWFYESNWTASV